MTSTRIVVAVLLSLLLTAPAFANEMGGMMQHEMMSGEVTESHQMMHDMMGMMKEMMGMLKDFSHNPSAVQKKRLGEMMDKLDEMMKGMDDGKGMKQMK
ncbi:MAG: hypothetical protein IT392_03470 [Nitrospirae bacterium]|nr:hypothetical protein [Nitrospirota bacterium]